MSHSGQILARLSANLDPQGDLPPPWAQFPTYERYCIGWRMGSGEDWLMMWSAFLDDLPRDLDARLAYLRRHPPAPISWTDRVWATLYPDEPELPELEDEDAEIARDEAISATRRDQLSAWGLIASDAAYTNWLARQERAHWPWAIADDPVNAARYVTRTFWFVTRQLHERRDQLKVPDLPPPWGACARALATGEAEFDPAQGLAALALMLCAGEVKPPWALGCTPDDFDDTFELDMGYVDAWRLWLMTFDDVEQAKRFAKLDEAPAEWQALLQEQLYFVEPLPF